MDFSISKKTITVFDFDGTILDGQSPVMIVASLYAEGIMPFSTAIRIGLWGLRYKIGLPHNEYLARKLLFKALTKMPMDEVDDILRDIYKTHIRKKIFEAALVKLREHIEANEEVVIVSASFDTITECFIREFGVSGQVSTIMEKKNGKYTGELSGAPVEGDEKVKRLRLYADEHFGENAWKIAYAYGDHVSDLQVLALAEHPVVVNPPNKLKEIAKQNAYEVIYW